MSSETKNLGVRWLSEQNLSPAIYFPVVLSSKTCAVGIRRGNSMAEGEEAMKPPVPESRKGWGSSRNPPRMEESMRGMGTVLLTGVAAVVAWKVLAAVFVGLLGLALKIGLVVAVVYFLLNIFNGKKKSKVEEG